MGWMNRSGRLQIERGLMVDGDGDGYSTYFAKDIRIDEYLYLL